MTLIGDHNAAASNQLPVAMPPRVAPSQIGESLAAHPKLHKRGEAKSPEEVKAAFTQFIGEAFYGQMIKAMRSTVGKPAYFHGGRGEEVFQGQLDQQMAQQLTATTAEKFAEPLFEHQFPQIAKQMQQNDLQELNQLRRK
jgi:flagellar protein FlgJ